MRRDKICCNPLFVIIVCVFRTNSFRIGAKNSIRFFPVQKYKFVKIQEPQTKMRKKLDSVLEENIKTQDISSTQRR